MTYRAWCFSGAAALMSILLAACGGGGGGGGGGDAPGGGVVTPPPPPPTFTSWSSLTPGSTVTISGKSVEATYTTSGGRIAAASPGPVSDSTFTQTLNAAGALVSLRVGAPGGTIGFDVTSGDLIGALVSPAGVDNGIVVARSSAADRQAIATNPLGRDPLGRFEYQSFGIWETGIGSGSGRLGAISLGASTPASALPATTGSASFGGNFLGLYVDADGADHVVTAVTTFKVDLQARSGQFDTLFTRDLVEGTRRDTINLSGKIGWTEGQNLIAGDLTAPAGRLKGRLTGQFFGPSASEFGGLITASSPDTASLERLIGGFGMSRH